MRESRSEHVVNESFPHCFFFREEKKFVMYLIFFDLTGNRKAHHRINEKTASNGKNANNTVKTGSVAAMTGAVTNHGMCGNNVT